MRRHYKKFLVWMMAFLMLSVVAVAAVKKNGVVKAIQSQTSPAMVLQEGKQYSRIPNISSSLPTVPAGKILVIEFFSYECPYCYQLEPFLEKWKLNLPKDVVLMRVPVEFRSSWTRLAKAYYAADILNIENKMTPLLFRAMQEDHMPFDTDESLATFFVQQGVAKKDFDGAFYFSPRIDGALMRGRHVARDNEISRVPSLLINGKYKTDVGMAGGPEVFFSVVDQLIANERSLSKK